MTMVTLDFSKHPEGLIPAVVQDYATREVLMLAYINEPSWRSTIESGYATFWSRSRKELWKKGATSGHVQRIKDILVDCDLDAVIFVVEQVGGKACHTGQRTCFYRRVAGERLEPTEPNCS